MAIEAAYASDVGRRRHNEDACLLDLDIGLMLVADGVGGHQAGEVASAITCEAVAQALRAGGDLVDGIRSANRAVIKTINNNHKHKKITTTTITLSFTNHNFELT